jgi:hypothetical protein
VARRASDVRFLSCSFQLFRPVCIGGRRSTSGREQIGTPNLVFGVGIALSQCTGPNPASRLLVSSSYQPSTAEPIIATRQLAERPASQFGFWLPRSEGYRKSEQGAGLIGRLRSSCRWWCHERGEWQGGGRSPAALGSPSEVLAGGPGRRQRADCT